MLQEYRKGWQQFWALSLVVEGADTRRHRVHRPVRRHSAGQQRRQRYGRPGAHADGRSDSQPRDADSNAYCEALSCPNRPSRYANPVSYAGANSDASSYAGTSTHSAAYSPSYTETYTPAYPDSSAYHQLRPILPNRVHPHRCCGLRLRRGIRQRAELHRWTAHGSSPRPAPP